MPPITRTVAKITIHDNEPITRGNIIVKFHSEEFPPNMLYMVAVIRCNAVCDVEETSLPYGYHDISSCHSKYSSYPFSTINAVARKLK